MKISKSLRPVLSNKIYMDDARRKMKEYNLDACKFVSSILYCSWFCIFCISFIYSGCVYPAMQGIAQALSVQKVADLRPYVDDFQRNILGKAPSDLAKSYPEYDHARQVGQLTSKVIYWNYLKTF